VILTFPSSMIHSPREASLRGRSPRPREDQVHGVAGQRVKLLGIPHAEYGISPCIPSRARQTREFHGGFSGSTHPAHRPQATHRRGTESLHQEKDWPYVNGSRTPLLPASRSRPCRRDPGLVRLAQPQQAHLEARPVARCRPDNTRWAYHPAGTSRFRGRSTARRGRCQQRRSRSSATTASIARWPCDSTNPNGPQHSVQRVFAQIDVRQPGHSA